LGLYSDALAADRSHDLSDAVKAQVESLIAARIAARGQKNWAESDRLRDQLLDLGILIMDSKAADGTLVTTWDVKR
jgi:cysteinyl-tRNA synthetase